MTPSTIATITTSSDAPIPPTTIPSIILENLPTCNSAFRFHERLRSLENTFSEYRQTNPFVDVVSAIPGIVHQYMTHQITEAIREAVQIQTDRLQDSLQRENDEFLRNIDENMKKIIKGQVKSQVKEQVSRRSTTGSQSRQLSASESAFAKEPVQNTCQMEEPLHLVFKTGADDQPIVQTSQHPKWFSQPRRPPSPDRDWNKTLPAAQGDAQSWISDLARQTDARSSFNELLDTLIDFSNFIMTRLSVATLTPELLADDEDDGNGEEDQGLRISKEERIQEEEEADKLYRDVDINQGRGLQVSQDIEDSHVTLTLVHPDGQQESSSVSSFVTSMLNPTSDAGVESIFTTASSPIAPLPTPTPIMTPFTIATITTSKRVKSLEVNFLEFMQTNQFAEAVSKISETSILKRRRRDDDDQEGPSTGSDRGSKRRREGREPESASTPSELATRSASRSTTGTQSRQISASESAFAEEPVQTTCQMDEPPHPPRKPPTPDRDWNKTFPAIQGSDQTWISELGKQVDFRSSFNELLDTLIDFSNSIMNRLCVDTLTPELLAGPTYELMRGSCTSLTELEYHLEEVYKATTDQLDWVNPEGQQYPHNLLQPLPLIPDNRGRRTKAADYGYIKWIEDLVPRTMWIQERLNYDKHALWGVSHLGRKHQQFYGFAVNRESALDVYSKRRIIAVT
nr:hypothetical protein [Tanacetum cinerariifolium]